MERAGAYRLSGPLQAFTELVGFAATGIRAAAGTRRHRWCRNVLACVFAVRQAERALVSVPQASEACRPHGPTLLRATIKPSIALHWPCPDVCRFDTTGPWAFLKAIG